MKNTDIESLLRGNKPQVKDNPTFLLEVQQKMRTVEGIKSEVDRQRRYGRSVSKRAFKSDIQLQMCTFCYLCMIKLYSK